MIGALVTWSLRLLLRLASWVPDRPPPELPLYVPADWS